MVCVENVYEWVDVHVLCMGDSIMCVREGRKGGGRERDSLRIPLLFSAHRS